MASLSLEESTCTSLTVSLNMSGSYSGNRRTITWYIAGNKKASWTFDNDSTYEEYTFTGLHPNYNYTIEVEVMASGWGSASTWSKTYKTDRFEAEIVTTDVTRTSITVYLDMPCTYPDNDRTLRWYLDGSLKYTKYPGSYATESSSVTFSGLSQGTTYTIRARITNTSGLLDKEYEIDVTTDKPSVSQWSWSSSNGNATSAQTRSAKTAIDNQGRLSNFSYLVWNDLVNKVNEALTAGGSSWSNQYADISSTRMSSNNKLLTATRFNSLRFNIGRKQSTGISDVSKGDVVYGWYFTRLTDRLNTYISKL